MPSVYIQSSALLLPLCGAPTHQSTPPPALRQATTAVTDAVDALDGVSRQDITTLDVSVQPQMVYDNDKGTQNITGYQFVQRLQVKVLNLTNDVLGAVFDAAVQAGGDNLQIEAIQARPCRRHLVGGLYSGQVPFA
jgi:uncharacterized protein YggE